VGVEEHIDHQSVNRIGAIDDLLVAVRPIRILGRQLQPVQSALARQRVTLIALAATCCADGVWLADGGGQQGIIAKIIVIIEIFIALNQAQNPLTDQLVDAVLDKTRITMIDKTLRKSTKYAAAFRQLPRQKYTSIRCDPSPVETGLYTTATQALELKLLWATLCLAQSGLRSA